MNVDISSMRAELDRLSSEINQLENQRKELSFRFNQELAQAAAKGPEEVQYVGGKRIS